MRERYYSLCSGRSKAHRIRYRPFGIEEYFHSRTEALAFRDRLVPQLEKLKALLPQLDASDYSTRLTALDYETVRNTIPDLLAPIDRRIAYIGGVSVDELDEDEARRSKSCTLRQLIQLYLEYRELEQMKPVGPGEIRRYQHWQECAISQTQCAHITKSMLLRERKKLMDSGLSDATVNRYMTCLSSAWTYLVNELELVDAHLPRKISKRREAANHTPAYTDDEVAQIIDLCYAADVEARTNRQATFMHLGPLIELFSETGIRHQFLSSLRWEHVEDLCSDDPRICREMKGGKEVVVPLSARAVVVLQRQWEHSESDYVFPSPAGERHSRRWYARFKRLLDDNGIRDTGKPVHSFRAYVATRLGEAGAGSNQIADMLGVTLKVAEGYRNRTAGQRDNTRDLLNGTTPKSAKKIRVIR